MIPAGGSTYTPEVGDRVRVGNGTRHWTVAELWTSPAGTELLATLKPVDGDGYTGTTVPAWRLTPTTEPSS